MKDFTEQSDDAGSETSEITTQGSNEEEEENNNHVDDKTLMFFDPDAVEERFRVDRRKLEEMLKAPDEENSKADNFFKKIMQETETVITWPSKLKIGAKSKKDPHIKIQGKFDAVKDAKEKIMAVLDTKSNRVTLKMDVPFTDHSHIIGKGGNSIKKVMQETNCHIHFPDSNRNNPTEKSNQVSIAGEPFGVEKARSRIRECLPLVFSFEMPVTGLFHPIPDASSPEIKRLEEFYGIKIQFLVKSQIYITTVMIRGNENQAKDVKAATQAVIDYFYGSAGMRIPVTMTMEVAPQHHSHLSGRGNTNLQLIMQQTQTTIKLPDAILAFQPRKGTITISGLIDGVYLARQKLIGCLPLVLMFDMKDDQEPVPTFISCLMEKFDVYISVKPKPKQPSRSIIVKGAERNAFQLYEARRYLLGLQYSEPPVKTTIPATYSMQFLTTMNVDVSPFNSNTNSTALIQGLQNAPSNPHLAIMNSKSNPNEYFSLFFPTMPDGINDHSQSMLTEYCGNEIAEKAPSVCSSTTSTLSSPNPSPRQGSPIETLDLQISRSGENLCNGNLLAESTLQQYQMFMESNETPKLKLVDAALTYWNKSDAADQSNGYQCKALMQHPSFPLDYEKKKLLANKAMKLKPQGPESRIPTNSWSGYGFSKSMPEAMVREKLAGRNGFGKSSSLHMEDVKEEDDNDPWKNSSSTANNVQHRRPGSLFSSSNYMEGIMLPRRAISKHTDLCDLLNRLGLDKYIDLFLQQEIDLPTFLTMTDQDLRDLGIKTFGARRKMILAISDMGKHNFAAAPGAERKSNSNGIQTTWEKSNNSCAPSMVVSHW